MKNVIIVLNLFFLIYSTFQEVNIPTEEEKKQLKQVENLLKQSLAETKARKLHKKRKHKRNHKTKSKRRRRRKKKHIRHRRKALLDGLLNHCHKNDPDCYLSLRQEEVQNNYRNFLNPHAENINQFTGIHDLKDAAAAGVGAGAWVYSNLKNKKRKKKLALRKSLMNEKRAFEEVYVKIIREENSRIDGINNELINLDKRLGSYQSEICNDIQAKSMSHENRQSALRRYDE